MSAGNDPIGLPVPDEYVGAFVAEVFEDVERSTTWTEAVDALVAGDARSDWEALTPTEQVVAMLDAAADFDERAVQVLEGIPCDEVNDSSVRGEFDEALRVRRNADLLRNAIADAYSDGYVDDDQLVEAVECHGFETETIARREDLLETVAEAHGFDFRPYGGTLMDPSDGHDRYAPAEATFDIECQ